MKTRSQLTALLIRKEIAALYDATIGETDPDTVKANLERIARLKEAM